MRRVDPKCERPDLLPDTIVSTVRRSGIEHLLDAYCYNPLGYIQSEIEAKIFGVWNIVIWFLDVTVNQLNQIRMETRRW